MKVYQLLVASAAAAFMTTAPAQPQTAAAAKSILDAFAAAPKTCGEDMQFRTGIPIVSQDPARPSLMGIVMGQVDCLATPVPAQETAGNLAYLTAQLAPAHVLEQLGRKGAPDPTFDFNYRGSTFAMQLVSQKLEPDLVSNNVLYCYDYDFVNKTATGQLIATGDMRVCVADYRKAAGNLPAVPLADYLKGPAPTPVRRGFTEPRDYNYGT